MTLTPVTLDRQPGLPPDGSSGFWLGWDAEGQIWMMFWHRHFGWQRLSFDVRNGDPLVRFDVEIIAHARVPERRES